MTDSLLIHNGTLISHDNRRCEGWLYVKGRAIEAFGAGPPPTIHVDRCVDAQQHLVLPGFIDLHVHGIGGFDALDGKKEALVGMAQRFASYGVTSFLPTTATASVARTREALTAIAACTGPQRGGATILGAHLEGPYLNVEKCGAQNRDFIRHATGTEARALLESKAVRLLALAPEIAENQWLISECARRGVTVSAAHTAATFAQMKDAVRRGVTQTTHTFNAMTGLHHREPGVVGAALLLPELRCELIADNEHVHPAVMAVLHRAKGIEGVILITDALAATGMPDGEYPMDGLMVDVREGTIRLKNGTLAGSTVTMDRAFSNYLQATGESVQALWPTSSLNAAKAIGVADRKGSIAVGKDADLVIVDHAIKVAMTIAEGKIVHESAEFSAAGRAGAPSSR